MKHKLQVSSLVFKLIMVSFRAKFVSINAKNYTVLQAFLFVDTLINLVMHPIRKDMFYYIKNKLPQRSIITITHIQRILIYHTWLVEVRPHEKSV